MEKKELVDTNEASPSAAGVVEGDSFTVRTEEDWDNHSVGLEAQNVDHDGPEFGNYQDDVLDNVTPHAVEKLEGDGFSVQSEDHDRELKDVKIQNIGHDDPGVEGDSFIVRSEEDLDQQSVGPEAQNVDHGVPEFGNYQDDVLDNVTPHAVEKLEGDGFSVQNEDHDKESKEAKIQNIGHDDPGVEGDSFTIRGEEVWDKHSMGLEAQNVDHDSPEFGNYQDDVLDNVNSQAVEKLEGDGFSVQNEDHDKELKEAKIQNIGHDDPGVDIEQEIVSDKIDEVIDVELSTHGETKNNVTEESQLSQRVDDRCDMLCGSQQENSKTSTVPGDLFQNEHQSDSMKSESEVNIDRQEYSSVKVDSSGDHDGPEFGNYQDDVLDNVNSQAVEKLEGDGFSVQNEDHDRELKEAKIQNIGHDDPGVDIEREIVSDKIGEVIDVELSTHEETKNNVTEESQLSQRVVDDRCDMLCGSQLENSKTSTVPGDLFQNEHQSDSMKSESEVNIDRQEYSSVKVDSSGDHDGPEFGNYQDDVLDNVKSQAVEKLEGDGFSVQNEDHDRELKEAKIQNIGHDDPGVDIEQEIVSDKIDEVIDVELSTHEETKNNVTEESQLSQRVVDDRCDLLCGSQQENSKSSTVPGDLFQNEHQSDSMKSESEVNIDRQEYSSVNVDSSGEFEPKSQEVSLDSNFGHHGLAIEEDDNKSLESMQTNQKTESTSDDNNLEPVVGGSEVPGTEVGCSKSIHTPDTNPEAPRVVEKAMSLKKFVKEKSIIAVSIMFRHLSGRRDECAVGNSDDVGKDASDLSRDSETKEVSEKTTWNPLSYIKMSSDVDAENKTVQREEPITEGPPLPIAMKGMIIVYTRLGCQECKEVRKFLYMKRLRYVEINIDVYPSRKMELEKNSGSTSVPKVFFNAILIGGLSTLKSLDESGKLSEKIDYLINEIPSFECPLPPFSGEDDVSTRGALDEMALIVRKMKECIVVKDRFCKLRRVANCFLGSEAVDFLSEDQDLERKEAVEFARKLASKLFFQHVLEENLFEDGNHLYRFLDDDPIVASMCYNIPRGISTVKPKPMTEVASRLRLLSYAMFEAYASEDGRHVDYRSMHGSEEFARYLRIVEELQRGEIWDLSREEKLAFFINLYNMMTIHAILVWGHPSGTLERRKLFVDFKYVIGGSTYSLSAIQNGILRVNQRPPYTLMKPFTAKDKRSRVALPFPEPLIHFALVYGSRSGPALRCYSPGDIDKELVDAARNFLRSGGLLIDFTAKVAYASKILKWFSVDFGKYEVDVLKHVSNYLDPAGSELLLDLLATSDLKVTYQPYDWGLNC